jgi:hypothetical protein
MEPAHLPLPSSGLSLMSLPQLTFVRNRDRFAIHRRVARYTLLREGVHLRDLSAPSSFASLVGHDDVLVSWLNSLVPVPLPPPGPSRAWAGDLPLGPSRAAAGVRTAGGAPVTSVISFPPLRPPGWLRGGLWTFTTSPLLPLALSEMPPWLIACAVASCPAPHTSHAAWRLFAVGRLRLRT